MAGLEMEKAVKYFEDVGHLKRKFGAYYKYLLPFYRELVAEVPELAGELIDRFEDVKVHLVNADEFNYSGKCRRVAHDGRYQCSIKLLANDMRDSRAEAYKRLENFNHEMLHAVIGKRFGRYDDATILNVPWANDFDNCDGEPFVLLGNIDYHLYTGEVDFDNYRGSGRYAGLIEEGVVEDWASDMTVRAWPNDEFATATPPIMRVNYTMATMLCGLWNTVSKNQLRKEFLTGVGDGSELSEKTRVFKNKLFGLIQTIGYTPSKRGKCKFEDFDIPTICERYTDVIDFCKDNYNGEMSAEDVEKFNTYYESLMTGEPLTKLVVSMCDINDATHEPSR